jgi:Collagen triple helix repeat (20 copies)
MKKTKFIVITVLTLISTAIIVHNTYAQENTQAQWYHFESHGFTKKPIVSKGDAVNCFINTQSSSPCNGEYINGGVFEVTLEDQKYTYVHIGDYVCQMILQIINNQYAGDVGFENFIGGFATAKDVGQLLLKCDEILVDQAFITKNKDRKVFVYDKKYGGEPTELTVDQLKGQKLLVRNGIPLILLSNGSPISINAPSVTRDQNKLLDQHNIYAKIVDKHRKEIPEQVTINNQVPPLAMPPKPKTPNTPPVVKDGKNGENGKDGNPGKDGSPGPQGPQGDKGVAGKDGVNGQNGKDGVNGQNGIDGKNGTDGHDGAPGKDGKDGTNGRDGINGTNGEQGIPGTAGKDGINGRDGVDGKNGTDGKDGAQGPQGFKGDKGDHGDIGPTGPQGPKGDPGQTIILDNTKGADSIINQSTLQTQKIISNKLAEIEKENRKKDSIYQAKLNDFEKKNAEAQARISELEKRQMTPGPKGDKGDRGPQGPQGNPGINGHDGKDGSGTVTAPNNTPPPTPVNNTITPENKPTKNDFIKGKKKIVIKGTNVKLQDDNSEEHITKTIVSNEVCPDCPPGAKQKVTLIPVN